MGSDRTGLEVSRRLLLGTGLVAAAAPGLGWAARDPGVVDLQVTPRGVIQGAAVLMARVAGLPVCLWAASGVSVAPAATVRQAEALEWLLPGQPPRPIALRRAARGLWLPLPGDGAGLWVEGRAADPIV